MKSCLGGGASSGGGGKSAHHLMKSIFEDGSSNQRWIWESLCTSSKGAQAMMTPP